MSIKNKCYLIGIIAFCIIFKITFNLQDLFAASSNCGSCNYTYFMEMECDDETPAGCTSMFLEMITCCPAVSSGGDEECEKTSRQFNYFVYDASGNCTGQQSISCGSEECEGGYNQWDAYYTGCSQGPWLYNVVYYHDECP